MKRTVSMTVLGFAVASTSVMAGVYISPADRAARQQERAAPAQRDEAAPGPSNPVSRGAPPQGRDGRGGGGGGERRGEDRRDDRGGARQADGGNDRRDDRRDYRGSNDARRDRDRDRDRGVRGNEHDWRDDQYSRPQWSDSRSRGAGDHDRRGRNDGGRPGWRDERGRDWHYSRDWYDRYRAEHYRYDRGRYLARQRFSLGIYYVPRGYAPRYWQRGQWLPSSYYSERRYHLVDYWRFDLYDPPFSARWVRVGDDALLIDLDSGEVLDVVFQLFW